METTAYDANHIFIATQFTRERDYWLEKLAGDLVKSSFPFTHNKTTVKPSDFDRLKFRLSAELSQRLMRVSNQSDGRLHVILTAALCVLLNKYTHNGVEDIIIGTPIYKQAVAGELVNTVLAIRNRLTDTMTFKELLLAVNRTIMAAVEHQNYPIETLLYQLNMSPAEDGFPLFDVAILLENIHYKKYLRHIDLNMVFSFLRDGEWVEGAVEYNPLRHDRPTVERIVDHYICLLQKAIVDVEAAIGGLDILSEKEKRQLLIDFNHQEPAYPRDTTIHEIFEGRVERAPERIAVVYENHQVTYEKLNQEANQVAAALRGKGIEPDTTVGIMIDPSVEMIAAILGILKAGAAYLPIDLDYPGAMIRYILKDSDPSVLLTNHDSIKNHSFASLQGIQAMKLPVQRTVSRGQIRDLNSLPFPDRSLVDYEKFNKFIGISMAKNNLALQTTRGCPYNCAFCHKIWPKTHVMRSAENIFEEVKLFYDLGIRQFAIIDDIFNLNRGNSSRFFRLMMDNRLKVQLFFPNGLRGDILTREYIDLMVEAGTTGLALALETASPRLQKLIGKNLDLDRLHENADYFCRRYPQIVLELFTMLGFPTETEEEALMTLNFIKSLRWIDFPIVSILKIYANSDMAKLALENGISYEAIADSQDLAFHELPETLPFSKNFTLKYQADFLNEYFLLKERLLDVLPYQLRALAEDEVVQKHNSYLPVCINCLEDLLAYVGMTRQELGADVCLDGPSYEVPDLNEKLRQVCSGEIKSLPGALRILFLDLSQFFSGEVDMLYDVVEAPLGLMYVMTYLNRQFGERLTGRVAKSRIDFDSFEELKALLETFKPDVIGLRTLTFFKDFFHKTASLIRQWGFAGPILTGGPYASSDYGAILQDRNIDLVVLGEGEVTAAEVIRKIMENGGKLPGEEVLKEIPGIAFIPGETGRQKKYAGYAREVVMLDEPLETVCRESGGHIAAVGQPHNLAYIIYTSGTTGRPKGMLIEHKNVVQLMFHDHFSFDFDHLDVWTMFHAYNFDFSVWEMYGALLYGGKLVVLPKMAARDTARFLEILKKERVTVLNQTPLAFYNLMAEELRYDERQLGLRYIIFGGDALSPENLKRWQEKYPGVQLINMYGITETTVHVTFKEIGEKEVALNSSTVGKPIPTLTAYVMDYKSQLLPLGVAGELCVGGEGVGRGYLNKIELTSEKFIANPYKKGERLYKSGDLAKVSDDGEIGYFGRIDRQVKVRGIRIELAEIESQLLKVDGLKESVVIDRVDETGERYLCAYMVLNRQIETSELRDRLSRKLPNYMIPAFFVQLEKIPLTANGKVDRQALPAPQIGAGRGGAIAPRDDIEAKIVEIWSEVLNIGTDAFGIDSNFFELGGHSLKATTLISKIHKELNVKIPIVEIFERQTVEGLADYIRGAAAVPAVRYASIKPTCKREYYPLSSAQKRLYILQQMVPDSITYNISQTFYLEESLDGERVAETFRRLIQRHESLRTSFNMVNEEPVQIIHETVAFKIDIRQGEIQKTVNQFVRPFDLSKAPLLRVGLAMSRATNVLLLDMHHIISDGISHGILHEDFMSLYRGKQLPRLRLQYKDYSQWQHEERQREAIKKQEGYWLKRFAGELPVLALPCDFPRPVIQSFEGDRLIFEMDQAETESLRRIARTEETTLFMVLLAVFNVLLSKLGGQDDVIVGTLVAGRSHTDLENIIGMFVNTLALRSKPVKEKSFAESLRELKTDVLAAFDNQDYPFEDLVDRLQLVRDTSRNPIFDVLFAWQSQLGPAAAAGVTPASSQAVAAPHNKISRFDITLDALETDERVLFTAEFCTKLFKPETIERLVKYYKNIASAIIRDGEQELARIEIITGEERARLLYDFNDTRTGYPETKTIHRLFEEQAGKLPDHYALVFEDRHLTYRQSNEKSNRLARLLREKGVMPDTPVAVLADRSLEMMVALLSILKAGGAYLPLDPDHPENRLNSILESSRTGLILSNDRRFFKGPYDFIDLNDPIDLKESPADLTSCCSSRNLAYVIYTSGSTGLPKGVMVEHRSVVNFIKGITDIIPFTPADSILSLTTVSFDIFGLETILPLTRGAKVVIGNREEQVEGSAISAKIEDEEITIFQITPSRLQLLIADEESARSLAGLKYLLVGGELFPEVLLNRVRTFTMGKIYNLYGPTETTIWSTIKDVTGHRALNIGKPIANTQVYILNQSGLLQPTGVVGELCIGGDGLARGYWADEQLTKEKFVPHPFAEGERIYKTGDLARWLGDGNIEYIGRIDHQVKIRGFRIELTEIEDYLSNMEGVDQAVVVDREDGGGQKCLCAYVVFDKPADRAAGAAELRSLLTKHLPYYMIPSYFVELETMPLTPNGKIDRKVLPEPEVAGYDEYVAPADDVERRLVEIWSEVLNIKKEVVGVHANFFVLGGHSLKATVLISKIHREFDVKMPLAEIFNISTVIGMAEYIKRAAKEGYAAIHAVEKKEYYVLSSAQKRLYILHQMAPESVNYNLNGMTYLDGAIDIERLASAFDALIQRHESLRTSFRVVNDETVQVINHSFDFKIIVLEKEKETESADIIHGFIKPFELSRTPLLRVGVIKIEEQKYIMVFDMHHIVADDFSFQVLRKDFMSVYSGNELPRLRLQYKDYSEWQNSEAQRRSIKMQEAYWLKEFAGPLPLLNIPTDFERPKMQSLEGDRIHFKVGLAETRALLKLAKSLDVTMYMILLAAYYILLSKLTGQEDIIIGTPVACRRHSDLENIIGLFVNMLALRNKPSRQKRLTRFLEEVKENSLQALENQEYQFEDLVGKVVKTREPGRSPIFDVMFNFLNQEEAPLEMGDEVRTELNDINPTAKVDLLLTGVQMGNYLFFELEYSTRLFRGSTVRQFTVYFKRIIASMIEDPGKRLAEIEIISRDEEERLFSKMKDIEGSPEVSESLEASFDF
jgi:amino acid adenylation domain-containing protein